MSGPADVPHELLGEQVRVRLDEEVWQAGRLLRLTVDGDVDLLADDGATLYCWPALEIQPR